MQYNHNLFLLLIAGQNNMKERAEPMRLAIIMNPIAGGGKAKEMSSHAIEVLQKAGFEVALMESTFAGASTGLARQAAQLGYNPVLACGGDGTVLEVVNGLEGTTSVMGILPYGRGNDVCKDLGLSINSEEALETIIHGHPRNVDAVKCRGRAFLGVGGVGVDGQAAVNAALETVPAQGGDFLYSSGILDDDFLSTLHLGVDSGWGTLSIQPHLCRSGGKHFNLLTRDENPAQGLLPGRPLGCLRDHQQEPSSSVPPFL
jgi:hypothetical protein